MNWCNVKLILLTLLTPVWAPCAEPVLFYHAAPYDFAEGDFISELQKRLSENGVTMKLLLAGNPGTGLGRAGVALPPLADSLHPKFVVLYFSETTLLNDYLYADSRSLPFLVRTIWYEARKALAFHSNFLDKELRQECLRYAIARMMQIKTVLGHRGVRVFFIADGQAKQSFGNQSDSLANRFHFPRAIRSLEYLPVYAAKAGIDLHVSYALGQVLGSENPDQALGAALVAIPLRRWLLKQGSSQ